MLKILAFLTKREDIETRAFIEYCENHHVPLICSMAPTPIVYKRNYLMRGDELNTQEDDTPDFDVVTELVFPDRAAYLAWGAALGTGVPGEQVAADELKFLDPSRSRAYVIEEHATTR
jgi:EthD domain